MILSAPKEALANPAAPAFAGCTSDGGTTWVRLTPVGGYPGSIGNSGNACLFPVGTGVFSGTSLTFAQQTVPLAPYQGQTVRLRSCYSTDGSVNPEGWYVDDLAVSHAKVPGSCVSGVILLADFEEGDTSEWSVTAP